MNENALNFHLQTRVNFRTFKWIALNKVKDEPKGRFVRRLILLGIQKFEADKKK